MAKTPKGHAKPDAWVASPTDRGRKSIKNDRVYMKHGEEFLIELFNPTQNCVLADIKVNGREASKNGLVLRPGQRFYLDCFIDDGKKLAFAQYEADDTDEAREAVHQNGLLEVFFYNESVVAVKDWKTRFDRVIERHYYPYNPWGTTWIGTPNIYFGTTNTGGSVTTTNTGGYPFAGTTVNNLVYSSGNFKVNTGRIERGAKSGQEFEDVEMQFESLYISSRTLQLLPEEVRPEEAKDLLRKEKPKDAIDLIRKLADLKEAGIITEEEFSAKKAELLSRI